MNDNQYSPNQPPNVRGEQQPVTRFPRRQHADTPFNSSKQECVAWLDSLTRRLTKEDQTVSRWLESYEAQLFEQFDHQSSKLKQQLCIMLDEALAQNKRQLKHQYTRFGQPQRRQIEDGKFKLSLLKCRISELKAELGSEHYKQGIIEVLSNDLTVQLADVLEGIQQALASFQEHVYLKVNANILDRFSQQTSALFFVQSFSLAHPQPRRFTFNQQANLPPMYRPPQISVEQLPHPNFGSTSRIDTRPTSVQIPIVNRSINGAQTSTFHPSRTRDPSLRSDFHRNRDAILSGGTSSPSVR